MAFVVKIAMGQAEHTFLKTWETALSPKRTRLTAWSDGDGADVPTRVLDLSDGHELVLPKEVGGTCAWLAEERFVALSGAKLITCSRAGEVLHSVAIRRDALAQAWVSKFGDENAGTSFLNPFPGRTDCVLVGWQMGGSQQGSWAATYRVDLKTGSATPWAVTDTIVASPDNRFFLTTRPRDLVEIPGGGSEWASPLLRGKVADPANQQPLVSGRVKVEGFDWRKS